VESLTLVTLRKVKDPAATATTPAQRQTQLGPTTPPTPHAALIAANRDQSSLPNFYHLVLPLTPSINMPTKTVIRIVSESGCSHRQNLSVHSHDPVVGCFIYHKLRNKPTARGYGFANPTDASENILTEHTSTGDSQEQIAFDPAANSSTQERRDLERALEGITIPEDLTCALCCFIVQNAVHVFWDESKRPVCGPCIRNGILQNGNVCPLSGEKEPYLESLIPDEVLNNKAKEFIDSVMVSGCPFVNPYQNIQVFDGTFLMKQARQSNPANSSQAAVSSDWETVRFKDRKQIRTYYASPVRKITFKLHKDAVEFDRLIKKSNGDEFKAWRVYTKRMQRRGLARRVVAASTYDTIQYGSSDNHQPCDNIKDRLMGCGWVQKSVTGATGWIRNMWLSPAYKIPFLWPKVAFEFDLLCRANGGDEEKAAFQFLLAKEGAKKKPSDFILGGRRAVECLVANAIDSLGDDQSKVKADLNSKRKTRPEAKLEAKANGIDSLGADQSKSKADLNSKRKTRSEAKLEAKANGIDSLGADQSKSKADPNSKRKTRSEAKLEAKAGIDSLGDDQSKVKADCKKRKTRSEDKLEANAVIGTRNRKTNFTKVKAKPNGKAVVKAKRAKNIDKTENNPIRPLRKRYTLAEFASSIVDSLNVNGQ
jgi:hypothetical protein